MNLARNARVSFEILLAHRLRTTLSCISIFIGVAATVLVVGAGQAAQRDLIAKVRKMGSNVLAVRAGRFIRFGRHIQEVTHYASLTLRDERLLSQNLSGVRAVSGVMTATRVLTFRGRQESVQLLGVDSAYFGLANVEIFAGRAFSPEEVRGLARVVVIGSESASELFDLEDPVGQSVRIGDIPFLVIGVTPESRTRDSGAGDSDKNVYVPLTTAMVRVIGRPSLDSILLQADNSHRFPVMRRDIGEVLRRSHHLSDATGDDFTIQDPVELLKAEHEMGGTFRALVGGIAAVALATGGIGIVVVMLMAVRERTREIGLRRAVGATKPAILVQFLMEAGMLTGLGGGAGALAGLVANAIVCRVAGWPLVWPIGPTVCTFGLSVVLGVACGTAPALRAALLRPAAAIGAAS